MEDCSKAKALASFLYYTQADPQAKSTADRYDTTVRRPGGASPLTPHHTLQPTGRASYRRRTTPDSSNVS
mgnify:FL=1